MDPNKDYDYRRNDFIQQSMLHPMVFNSLLRVQLEREEGLKNLLLHRTNIQSNYDLLKKDNHFSDETLLTIL